MSRGGRAVRSRPVQCKYAKVSGGRGGLAVTTIRADSTMCMTTRMLYVEEHVSRDKKRRERCNLQKLYGAWYMHEQEQELSMRRRTSNSPSLTNTYDIDTRFLLISRRILYVFNHVNRSVHPPARMKDALNATKTERWEHVNPI